MLIEAWVNALQESQLNEQCRKSGNDFFGYMKAHNVSARALARMIIDATGYNPAQLWTVQDAALLRDAIFRYEASVAVAQRDDSKTAQGWAKKFWE